ncbi:MAG: hypothetical protein MJB57_10080 [Gemmatimonadetes bacterium]|nr:hypothetical protein [Gemmatimonadota bacterium]
MNRTHRAGLVLWRGGLLLAIGYVVFERIRAILAIADPQLEIAVSVLLVGLFFVLLSVVIEQVRDARAAREVER